LLGLLIVGVASVLTCSFVVSFAVPSSTRASSHALQLRGASPDGPSFTFDEMNAPDGDGFGSFGLWAGACAAPLVGMAIVLGAQRRVAQKRSSVNKRVTLRANALEQLRTMTTVVADTGVLEEVKKYKPQDATTNPSLVLKALSGPDAKSYFDRAIAWAASSGVKVDGPANDDLVEDICERLAVLLGCDILKVVPGLVSTEVDAKLSFNTAKMIEKGRKIVGLYAEQGFSKERVLVKLGTTWEAIPACKQLESEGIHCNMTLVFSLAQAVACAEAGATLISPFVGRILDWYKAAEDRDYEPEEDPGVLSVQEIYKYYKNLGYETTVMGASFRSPYEVLELSGCDKMTISPTILDRLEGINLPVLQKLSPEKVKDETITHLEEGGLSEEYFRWLMNENAMATESLAKGIRGFAVDGQKLEDLVRKRLASK